MSIKNTPSEVFELFDRKAGARVWPSSDPNDEPFDTYTCKLCDEQLVLQSAGEILSGQPNFQEQTISRLMEHIKIRHVWKLTETKKPASA